MLKAVFVPRLAVPADSLGQREGLELQRYGLSAEAVTESHRRTWVFGIANGRVPDHNPGYRGQSDQRNARSWMALFARTGTRRAENQNPTPIQEESKAENAIRKKGEFAPGAATAVVPHQDPWEKLGQTAEYRIVGIRSDTLSLGGCSFGGSSDSFRVQTCHSQHCDDESGGAE
ncbi:uncharacterized protein CLUP02_05729 [Colletotrichum lupini]|uniref:Uncharacterized protein n=1 Tax=Colletotrichum lupini TaxID=145971 RepID=A0A9Q8SMS6_9PEZI|nr:uncharacterized protein CLUP02_05729 [Colletotrichum lupini]UQC80247.1 hypothetical protein CLUP02_05729 [Colletotrichum lupini]